METTLPLPKATKSLALQPFGAAIIALVTAALCAGALILRDGSGAIFPSEWQGPPLTGALILFLAAALAASVAASNRIFWYGVGAFWALLFSSEIMLLARSSAELTAFVAPIEALVIVLAVSRITGPPAMRAFHLPLLVAASLMLLLFGSIHLLSVEAISGMIPAWIPARKVLPVFTGTFLLAAGAGLLWPKLRTASALAVALVFASWLPLVHAERLIDAPLDQGEWRFALTAAGLAGALLVVASLPFGRPAQDERRT